MPLGSVAQQATVMTYDVIGRNRLYYRTAFPHSPLGNVHFLD